VLQHGPVLPQELQAAAGQLEAVLWCAMDHQQLIQGAGHHHLHQNHHHQQQQQQQKRVSFAM
jgi:hypothetical protein